MKKIFKAAAVLVGLSSSALVVPSSDANASTVYDFSENFGSGYSVTGSFSADASSNGLTNVNDIFFSINGGASKTAIISNWDYGAPIVSLTAGASDFALYQVNGSPDWRLTESNLVSPIAKQGFLYTSSVGGFTSSSALNISAVPLPSALPLFGGAIVSLAGIGAAARRRLTKKTGASQELVA